MNPIYLVLIFLASTILGYLVIKKVPSLLHTPLMSGMNALSGITVLGAIVAVGVPVISNNYNIITLLAAGFAVIFATINVVAGFMVTNKMLNMFSSKKKKGGQK